MSAGCLNDTPDSEKPRGTKRKTSCILGEQMLVAEGHGLTDLMM